jgi:hypothetical protein
MCNAERMEGREIYRRTFPGNGPKSSSALSTGRYLGELRIEFLDRRLFIGIVPSSAKLRATENDLMVG